VTTKNDKKKNISKIPTDPPKEIFKPIYCDLETTCLQNNELFDSES